ncbi:MAG: ATP-binding cassette domain-containing protein, partial [Betaproteobacteria bacterium]
MEDECRAATRLSLQPDRLVLGPGEWLQVIGESSSGKSTLVRWLSGQADT